MIVPHAFRLTKGKDLKQSILDYVQQHNIQAGSVLSGVGCLSHAVIRLADERNVINIKGPLEILTLSGTLTPEHIHLHISVANKKGEVTGGHLVDGCYISYTAEICIVEYCNLRFMRKHDINTGFQELVVE